MPYPQIELWLYDTWQELDREAREGKVCSWSAVQGLSRRCPARLSPSLPRNTFPRPDYDLTAQKAVVAANCQAGIPTQISFPLKEMADLDHPLLVAATWQQLPVVFGFSELRSGVWADQSLTLHYHGFTRQLPAKHLPRFPAHFPHQPYPLHSLLQQALSSRRRPLPHPARPFPIDVFWRDDYRNGEDVCSPTATFGGLELLRGWKLYSRLPDQGIFTDHRLWDSPLSCRYPTPWIIEQRRSLCCTAAYTVFMGQKHPDWPELLCCAIQDLSPVTRRWMLVLDNCSPNPAETILSGHCLCFAVDVPAHSITITRDDDARAEFCQALESYNEDLHIPQDGFPF